MRNENFNSADEQRQETEGCDPMRNANDGTVPRTNRRGWHSGSRSRAPGGIGHCEIVPIGHTLCTRACRPKRQPCFGAAGCAGPTPRRSRATAMQGLSALMKSANVPTITAMRCCSKGVARLDRRPERHKKTFSARGGIPVRSLSYWRARVLKAVPYETNTCSKRRTRFHSIIAPRVAPSVIDFCLNEGGC